MQLVFRDHEQVLILILVGLIKPDTMEIVIVQWRGLVPVMVS